VEAEESSRIARWRSGQDKESGSGRNRFGSVETGDHSGQWLKQFAEVVGAMPEVLEFYRMVGRCLHVASGRFPISTALYDYFYKRLIRGAAENLTPARNEKIKSDKALPIP